jgi:3-oxoacyl-[acyl-carrier protein] reductase
MNLDIEGRRALVCAGSKGLGRACAEALAREGCVVTITGRDEAALAATAAAIAERHGKTVHIAVGDIATSTGRQQALRACPAPDILVTNAGGPPMLDFRQTTHEQWLAALETNLLSAVSMVTACIDAMVAQRFGRIVNITSMAEARPKANAHLSSAPRLALAGFCKSVASQVAQHNVTINNLLPGPFATERQQALKGLAESFVRDSPSKRLGDPFEFGQACAFLCGAHGGFINGHSLLIDGGFSL